MALPIARRRKEPRWVLFFTGGAAAMSAEAATQPMDTTKVRLQLQGSGALNKNYTGVFNCVQTVLKEEGALGLYKGLVPGLFRQMVYSSIRMGIYEPLRNFLAQVSPMESPDGTVNPLVIPLYDMILAGGSAGSIGSLFSSPFDLLKIRMQADATRTRYPNGFFSALISTARSEGFFGLWTGVVPSMQRAFLVNSAELATYDYFKQFLLQKGLLKDNLLCHFTSSMVSGLVAAVVVSPVDVAKTRLMSQKHGAERIYTGVVDCIHKTVRREGFFALFKGFLPLWLRIGPWCTVMFVTYERYRHWAKAVWLKE